MKKLVPAAIIIGSLFSAAAAAQTYNNGFYLGGHYGQHKVELDSEFASTDVKFGVAGVNAGFQLNSFMAIEARYAIGVEDEHIFNDNDSVRYEIDRHMALMAKGMVPLGDRFSLFATAGYGETRYGFVYDIPGLTGSQSSTESGFIYGAGANFYLTNRLSLVAEYTILPDLEDEDNNLVESDVSLMTVGLNYRF